MPARRAVTRGGGRPARRTCTFDGATAIGPYGEGIAMTRWPRGIAVAWVDEASDDTFLSMIDCCDD